MMQKNEHRITRILPGSIAEELEIEPGDVLLLVNDHEIKDVFDYRYQINEEYLTITVRKPDGEEWEYEIEKDYEDDLGLEFESGLMDSYRACCNRCIFCFIDQMPPGMRKTLYFKDDDSRLSFLQGNYITLTNMKDEDIERMIMYKLAPVNISVHTMNPSLRCRMLNNRFAGEALKKMRRLYEAGMEMNGQIVLCKGINDKEELECSIRELTGYIPHMKSVSVVPVGLTKYREGLYPLEAFHKQDALEVLQTVHRWQEKCFREYGTHFVHAGDEWYIMADMEFPEEERYDGYVQLENGVGMMRLLLNEFRDALARERDSMPAARQTEEGMAEGGSRQEGDSQQSEAAGRTAFCGNGRKGAEKQPEISKLSVASGKLAAPFLTMLSQEFMQQHPDRQIEVFPIQNVFFGEQITVSGLLTGQDILNQLKGRDLGSVLLLPCSLMRSGEEIFLDDMTLDELKKSLQVQIVIVNSNGQDLHEAFLHA